MNVFYNGQHTGLWPSCHRFNKVLLLLLTRPRVKRSVSRNFKLNFLHDVAKVKIL